MYDPALVLPYFQLPVVRGLSIGTGGAIMVPANPNRVAWLVTPWQGGDLLLTTVSPTPPINTQIYVTLKTTYQMIWSQMGILTTVAWYAVGTVNFVSLTVTEVIFQPERG